MASEDEEGGMGFWDALGWPQEQLKKNSPLTEDNLEWFSQGDMPTWMWASGNAAADALLDPLNLVPFGLLGKAAKAIPGVKRAGMEIASFPNYIKNHYGLTDGPLRASPLESTIMKVMPGDLLAEEQKLGLLRKITGFGEFAVEGVKGALKTSLSPSARATYADTGVNKSVQDIVSKHLRNGEDPRALAKATANVNYNQHINQQAGRVGDTAESMRTIGERSNLEDYTPNKSGTISDWMQKNSGTVTKHRKNAVTRADPMSDADAKYIEKHVLSSWGGADTVVMKRPNTQAGGNHFNDLFKKSPLSHVVGAAFLKHKGVPTLRQLYDTLKKLEKSQPAGKRNKFKIKNGSFENVEKNGLWLKGSLPGSAITEGGVNWVAKVDPSGKIMGVISDKHDFLEKIPVLGTAVGHSLPRDLVAVTPPMKASIQAIKNRQWDAGGFPKNKETYSGIPSPKMDKKNVEVLEDFVKQGPSATSLRTERIRQAGYITAPVAAISHED